MTMAFQLLLFNPLNLALAHRNTAGGDVQDGTMTPSAAVKVYLICIVCVSASMIAVFYLMDEDQRTTFTRNLQSFEDNAGALLANQGKDPVEVADMIVNGIAANDFWIITHADWKDVMVERAAAMKRDNTLYTGFGG